MANRQVVLDTETTGLEVSQGHRIIEIGCVEVINRRLTGRHYHVYINPEREVDAGAQAVHGISNEFLTDKPIFSAIADEFLDFVDGAELVIHNAAFDIGFINAEISLLKPKRPPVTARCSVTDTLLMARQKHPGQRASLDALCKRYEVDNSKRDLHGALLDAQILAQVYLAMTGGQTALVLGAGNDDDGQVVSDLRRVASDRPRLNVILPTEEELTAHEKRLDAIQKAAGKVIWRASATTP